MIKNLLLLLFLLSIVIFLVWNTLLLRKILKLGNQTKTLIGDEKYFELKYRMQLISSLGAIFLFIMGYIGINSYDKLNLTISSNIESKYKSLNIKLKKTDTLIYKNQNNLIETKSKQNILSDGIQNSKKEVNLLEKEIINLKNTYHRQPDIYIIRDLSFDFKKSGDSIMKDSWHGKKFLFKNLKTISGEHLPIFKYPPIINFTSSNGLTGEFTKITSDYFLFTPISSMGGDVCFFDIWIAYVEK